MGYRRRHEDMSFHPLRYGIGRSNPFADIMFFGHQPRSFSFRTSREKETRVETPRRERRCNPSTDIYQPVGIDAHADFFEQFSSRTLFRVFIRIELSAGESMKATLKHHLRRTTHPKHFKFRSLSHQNNRRRGTWTGHETEYKEVGVRRLRPQFALQIGDGDV